MMREDMSDYFARLRAAHAPAPAEQRPILIANNPPEEPAVTTGPIRSGLHQLLKLRDKNN